MDDETLPKGSISNPHVKEYRRIHLIRSFIFIGYMVDILALPISFILECSSG